MKINLKEKLIIARRAKGITQIAMAKIIGIDTQTYSRWERGVIKKIPSEALEKIAKATSRPLSFFSNDDVVEVSRLPSKQAVIQKIPLISWVSANRFSDAVDPFPPGSASEWIYSTNKGGNNMFALKVANDCMTPEFQDGDIIIVRSGVNVANGDYVIVKDTRNETATFKQYKVYGEKVILHPLNPKYQDIELDHDERYEIIGKVVEKVKRY
jgi:SOS-response transcriptional repressor LexA